MKKVLNQICSVVLAFILLLSIAEPVLAYKQVENGSKGNDVKTMQKMLNKVMNAGLEVDGDCGPKSVAAIKNFQKKYGLEVDGICGKNTWAKLESEYNKIIQCTNHVEGDFSHTDSAHPHKQYYKCANCGATYTDGSTTKVSSCKTCNPPAQNNTSYKTVRNGSQGEDVKIMQKMLNEVMNARLEVDGICGAKSVQAIKNFQKACNISVDGICGKDTWAKLTEAYESSKTIKPVAGSITIGKGRYSPGTLYEGSTYSISGKITSTYNLTNVTVGIYNSDGSKTSSVKTVSPNKTTYDINSVDSYIKFGRLSGNSEGKKYYFKVTATDINGNKKVLVNEAFTVKAFKIKYSSYKSVDEFQDKVLETWIVPVKDKFLKIPKTGRAFGASRENGRKHAGIDYYVSKGEGTPVYAMQSGIVIEYISNFYYGTSAVAIQHDDGSIARYCEISTSLRRGDSVKQGDIIAKMKANSLDDGTMLHLELYLGTAKGGLSSSKNKYSYVSGKFNRRSDLINPEFLLEIGK